MADQARVPDQGALHSELLPAPRSDRAVMGADASPRDPQPKPPELQRLLPIRSAFPARGGAEKLGRLLRFGYRQFPRHQPCRFSGSQGVGVYLITRSNFLFHATIAQMVSYNSHMYEGSSADAQFSNADRVRDAPGSV